ncbi:GNAT family N-acetyltransferase [Alkalihalobacillus pseudalcaliphilus]|uniref:GNAT family N-acetyltransferase n=1 Tax=Alkalihalobacillus pseudalcaliphilus TaxID=79884 RepID=UPI00064D931D|nr:GNAT family N-acetyltransferase [Alkalihalobacillus pseudalcaliphilus]KMK74761.1 acetyltransferase [Alkalihalobacillus pseudalcaliphilus]
MVHIFQLQKDASEETLIKLAHLLLEQQGPLAKNEPFATDMHAQILATIKLAQEEHSHAHIFIAEKEQAFVGAAFLNVAISIDKGGHYIWLNDLFVHKEHRNQGIAKKILLKVIYWAETKNIKGIELETGINNEATKALYNSLGFYDIISKRYGFGF